MTELVHVKGLAELGKFMQQLPAKMEANVMRGALRAGANVVQQEAKSLVPVDTGTLRDGIKVRTGSRRGRVTASVRATGKHAYIARWIEFGTAARRIVARKGKGMFFGGRFVKGVDHPGAAPKAFMRPALDKRAQDALLAAGNYIKRRLATKHGLDTADVELEAP